jgi:prevent-host-death family protein
MSIKFSEDVIPLTDIKINPGKVVRHTNETHRPVLLTSRGRGVAVMQSLEDYERAEEEKAFMRAVVEGLNDLDNEQQSNISDVKKRLGLK